MQYANFLLLLKDVLLHVCDSIMVNLPILHFECALGLTRTFWIDGSCSDPEIFLFMADAWRKKFMPQVQMRRYISHIEVAAADIRDLPRQLRDTSNICFDVYSMLQQVPTTRTDCTEKGVLWSDNRKMIQWTEFVSFL